MGTFYNSFVTIIPFTLVLNRCFINGAVIEPGSRGNCMLEINPSDVTVVTANEFDYFPSSNPSKSIFRRENGHLRRDVREMLLIPEGRDLHVKCSDSKSTFRLFDVPSLGMECRKGQLVTGSNHAVVRQSIECFRDDTPRSQIVRNGNCGGISNGTKLEIHFRNIDSPYMMYWVCFDEKSSIALYSVGKINGGLIAEGVFESGKPRPQFRDPQGIFPFDVNNAYKRVQQDETLAHLLGSQEFVDQSYIPTDQYYFSRGHLFPNGDPIYKYEKDSTFYYVNAVPQWQITNAGNWEKVERAVRNLAEKLRGTVTVWTGTYEVLQLPDINGNLVSLYLGETFDEGSSLLKKRLPVPKFLWKVAHHEASNGAVAFVQVNNPWAKISADEILCESICDDLRWVDFQIDDVKRGFTYCCDVNSLKQKIQFMPDIKYTKVLNYNEPEKTEINETDEDVSDEDDLSDGSAEQETSSSSEESGEEY